MRANSTWVPVSVLTATDTAITVRSGFMSKPMAAISPSGADSTKAASQSELEMMASSLPEDHNPKHSRATYSGETDPHSSATVDSRTRRPRAGLVNAHKSRSVTSTSPETAHSHHARRGSISSWARSYTRRKTAPLTLSVGGVPRITWTGDRK